MSPSSNRKDIFIAVMGSKGAGKSTFVNLVTKSDKTTRGAESDTARVQSSDPILLLGHRVTLLDTPGFNDEVTDTNILKEIALALHITHQAGFPLSGVIYMHSLTKKEEEEMSSPCPSLTMFQKLCDKEAFKNVAVVINRWESVPLDVAESQEGRLLKGKNLFKPFVDNKACVMRHDNGYNSAINIVRHFINNDPLPLCIQKELADRSSRIINTSAAKHIQETIKTKARQHYDETRQHYDEQMKKKPGDRSKYQARIEKLEEEHTAKVAGIREEVRRDLQSPYEMEKAAADGRVAQAIQMLSQRRDDAIARGRKVEELTKQLKKGKQLDDKKRGRINAEIAELKKKGISRRMVMNPAFGVLAVVLDITLSTSTEPVVDVLRKYLSSP